MTCYIRSPLIFFLLYNGPTFAFSLLRPFKKLNEIAITSQTYEGDHCINSNCLLHTYPINQGCSKIQPADPHPKWQVNFLKNNIIRVGYATRLNRVGYPTRLNRVGSWATKYIESGNRQTVMYYLQQVEIYALNFYDQYSYKKLIIVVCFSFHFKVYYPFKLVEKRN